MPLAVAAAAAEDVDVLMYGDVKEEMGEEVEELD